MSRAINAIKAIIIFFLALAFDFTVYPLVSSLISSLTAMNMFDDTLLKAILWGGVIVLMITITIIMPLLLILDTKKISEVMN